MIEPKPVKERTNLDLLELVCQLHSRALQYPSKEMHDAYMEARQELEARLEQKLNKHVVMGWPPDHKTIRAAAIAHMENECTNGFIDDQMKRYCTKDFIAGAEWALSQAACP